MRFSMFVASSNTFSRNEGYGGTDEMVPAAAEPQYLWIECRPKGQPRIEFPGGVPDIKLLRSLCALCKCSKLQLQAELNLPW